MKRNDRQFDTRNVRVLPLHQRQNLTRLADVLIDPDAEPETEIADAELAAIKSCAARIQQARARGAAVLVVYGAHLLRNGTGRILGRMMRAGWITHLATNGAGTIHDWEFSYQGESCESVRANVATGTFGTWDETGRNIHLALIAGGVEGSGYGESLGRFIEEDGVILPDPDALSEQLRTEPEHPRTAARWELWNAMRQHQLAAGSYMVRHPWKKVSILAQAHRYGVPFSVHPGIGYDIISNHPWFNGAAIGRAAEIDFRLFASAVNNLDHGVVLSVGSAIMGPQVFEKTLSCVNNVRLQDGRDIVQDHTIYVVDLQDGGGWDWSGGEPPKTNPAYYLRFCKSYARMGGEMNYLCCDNARFMHRLYHELRPSHDPQADR